MRARERKSAIRALDRMSQIVRNEMLVRGQYVNDFEDRVEARRGAICGGFKFCAIGSLWAGAGIKPDITKHDSPWPDSEPWFEVELPGVEEHVSPYDYGKVSRDEFLESRPSLRVAYDALNAAADRFIARRGINRASLRSDFTASVEALFEAEVAEGDYLLDRDDLLSIIHSAKRSLMREAA